MEAVKVSGAALSVLAAVIGYPGPGGPSVRDVAAAVDRTISTVHDHLKVLRRLGLVDWVDGQQRTLRATVKPVPYGVR